MLKNFSFSTPILFGVMYSNQLVPGKCKPPKNVGSLI